MIVFPKPSKIQFWKVGNGHCVRVDLLKAIDIYIRTHIHQTMTIGTLFDDLIKANVFPRGESLPDWYTVLRNRPSRKRDAIEAEAWAAHERRAEARKAGAR